MTDTTGFDRATTDTTPEGPAAGADLDAAEERDDETRLASLEALLAELEAELERDDPANRPA
ncbi:MAG: hypothetical protein M3174_05875 [Actinomycetota bacterium]|nr:hypothetical protein [Actinomycetota bacterium]